MMVKIEAVVICAVNALECYMYCALWHVARRNALSVLAVVAVVLIYYQACLGGQLVCVVNLQISWQSPKKEQKAFSWSLNL